MSKKILDNLDDNPEKEERLPYDEYWKSKGAYGLTRVVRKNSRKQKRKKRDNRACQRCKHAITGRSLHSCPYASDMHNDDTPHCNCCSSCTHDCAMDI